jgi:hypothetical protein
MILLSDRFSSETNLAQLEPKYDVSKEVMREYILQKLKNTPIA